MIVSGGFSNLLPRDAIARQRGKSTLLWSFQFEILREKTQFLIFKIHLNFYHFP
jgi:hypothetical protein